MMENILLTGSCIYVLLSKHRVESCNIQLLFLNCVLCFVMTVAQTSTTLKWTKNFRANSKIGLAYGCSVLPIITYVIENATDVKRSVLSSLLSVLSICFVAIFSRTNHIIKYCVIGSSISFIIYYVQCLFTYFNYSSWFFKFCIFSYTLLTTSITFQKSFSVGESILVSQLLACLLPCKDYVLPDITFNLWDVAVSLGRVTAIFVACVILSFTQIKETKSRTAAFYTILLIVGLAYSALNKEWLSVNLNGLLYFVVQNYPTRILLLIFWCFIVFMCGYYINERSSKFNASTSERKIFHAFILLVYVPGLAYDIPLLFFCSVCACCIFVVLGIIHAFKIEPFGMMLQNTLVVFTGKQDCGILILTPVCLLLGLSLPIWLACLQFPKLYNTVGAKCPITCYSGILSVGIGDAFASIIGSKYGTLKLSGSSKTVEGTIASIISQLIFVCFLSFTNAVSINVYSIVLSIVIVSVVEAYTDQIDNLVLPLLMYMLLNE